MIIGLCLPSGDDVKMDFTLSLSAMVLHTAIHSKGDIEIRTYNPRASLPEIGRFIAARSALEHSCDKLMWVDSDMTFPQDALSKLLAYDLPIVGATYCRRREPHTILGVGVEDVPPGATGLVRMQRMPFGFVLVDADVFRKMPKPWFAPLWDAEQERWHSEDYMFCERAREAGFDVWCDLDLSHDLGHCALKVVYWGDNTDEDAAP